MQKFTFTDGDQIGVFDGEKTRLYESEYIKRYREYAQSRKKNDEWKHTGEGARFRGDFDRDAYREERIDAYINGTAQDGEKVVYCFTVNQSSGIYKKAYGEEKAREEHLYSSSSEEFLSLCYNERSNACAVTVRADPVTSQIGLFDCNSSQLKTLTDGDARDANPTFSPVEENVLYFDTAGVGRTADGEFTGKYSPAQIVKLHLNTMEIEEVLSDEKSSFVKPKISADGTLYCIQRPIKEKKGGNPLLEILLIPVRIIQAIVLFISAFVTLFTGKSMTSGGENPAKGRETDNKKLLIDGNYMNVEKELKRNRRFQDREYGFIPHSWKLVKVNKDGAREILEHGVCDFALCEDGSIYFTDGKHIFHRNGIERKKVADTTLCLSVSTAQSFSAETDLFAI